MEEGSLTADPGIHCNSTRLPLKYTDARRSIQKDPMAAESLVSALYFLRHKLGRKVGAKVTPKNSEFSETIYLCGKSLSSLEQKFMNNKT